VSFFSRLRSAGSLPVEGHLPGFDRATGWLNSPPLSATDLQGKVVLVDFWTYTCINWLRTLAYVRAWAEKYQDEGLVVIGVHTPEIPFERDVDNVRQAVKDMAVEYPVALDSDYAIWQAFANRFWPAVYIADAEGRIRHHQFGEGGYAECEMVIQRLLGESGRDTVPHDLVSIAPGGFEAQADWASLASPETYLGYEQARGFASPGDPVLISCFASREPSPTARSRSPSSNPASRHTCSHSARGLPAKVAGGNLDQLLGPPRARTRTGIGIRAVAPC
jgi:thiol-disulfide isomerase/thioredoxin